MKMIKYITLDQLIYWSATTAPFTFEGVTVNPASQWETVESTILPFLNGSMDNPYSTTTPKEKLPQYFTTAAQIGSYLNDEFGDRLVAIPFRAGEFYYKLNRNLNKDEAMEIILQELISKAYNFVSVYGFQFLKLFGTSSLKYDPRYSIQEHIRKQLDFGIHETDNNYGARLKTDTLGPTSESKQYGATQDTTQYGAQSGSTTVGARTDTHSETQMNDLTFKNKSQDAHSSATDSTTIQSHTDTTNSLQHTDTTTTLSVTNTTGDQAVKDTITDKAHQNIETTDREATGVKTIQELLTAERELLNWNPVVEFFKAFTDKILLRVYYY